MTKLESAEKLIKQSGFCNGIPCTEECCLKGQCYPTIEDSMKCKLAIKYKKEHEMKKIDLNEYKGKYVMHFNNKKEFDTLCKFMHSNGKKWGSGKSYLNSTYLDDSFNCLNFNDGWKMIESNARDSGYTILEFDDFDWSEEWQPLKGKEYEFANNKGFDKKEVRKLYTFDKELMYPYVSVDKDRYIQSWLYCREIKPKYKAYTEFDPSWMFKEVKLKGNGKIISIVSIVGYKLMYRTVLILQTETRACYEMSLEDALKTIEWLDDDTPFGELIK